MVRSVISVPNRGHGTFPVGFRNPGVDRFSRVVASITEVTSDPAGELNVPFIGDAHMQVLNVAPHDPNQEFPGGIVYLRISIGISEDLNYLITLIIDP